MKTNKTFFWEKLSNSNKSKTQFLLCNETKSTYFLKTKNATRRMKKRGVINLEVLGGNLVHFFGESIEVVDGVVDGVNHVDRRNCGVPVAGDDEN